MLPLVLHWFFIEWYSGKKRLALPMNVSGWTDAGIIISQNQIIILLLFLLKVVSLFWFYILITLDCGKKT